jgi:hypothetical protein
MKTEPLIETLFTTMSDGKQYTLDQLSYILGAEPQTVSARLRDLRKTKYGGHTVTRKHLGGRVYGYTLDSRRELW